MSPPLEPPILDYSRPPKQRGVWRAIDVCVYAICGLWSIFWLSMALANVVGRFAGGPRNPFTFKGALVCFLFALIGVYGFARRRRKRHDC